MSGGGWGEVEVEGRGTVGKGGVGLQERGERTYITILSLVFPEADTSL